MRYVPKPGGEWDTREVGEGAKNKNDVGTLPGELLASRTDAAAVTLAALEISLPCDGFKAWER